MPDNQYTIIREHRSSSKLWIPIIILSVVVIMLLFFALIKNNELSKSQKDLLNTQSQLSSTSAELLDTKSQLTSTNDQLSATQTQLTSTQNQLTSAENQLTITKNQLSDAKTQLTSTEGQLTSAQNQLSSTNSQLATAQSQLTSTQAQLTSTKATLTLYQNTWGSVVSSGVGTNWKDDSGKPIVLATNSASTNPTWSQLQSFILSDKTDQNIYKPGYTCGDFAQDLYNNAEKAGIRTAWVYILFSDKTAHACDAFQTSVKGLVFIDDTGLTAGQAGPPNMDKIGNVRLGIDYVPTFLFSSNWTCGNIGKIVDVQIYW